MASVMEKTAMALFIALFAQLEFSIAAIYKVGDTAGWTTVGNVDYKQWAAVKTFDLGDVILFEYNQQFHNVMQVTHVEYKACNASSPIVIHNTGNDSITITTRGHHFFLCGVPGHCQAGQKVDINVPRTPVVVAPPPSILSPPAVPAAAIPAPSPSRAAPLLVINVNLLIMVGWAIVVACSFV